MLRRMVKAFISPGARHKHRRLTLLWGLVLGSVLVLAPAVYAVLPATLVDLTAARANLLHASLQTGWLVLSAFGLGYTASRAAETIGARPGANEGDD